MKKALFVVLILTMSAFTLIVAGCELTTQEEKTKLAQLENERQLEQMKKYQDAIKFKLSYLYTLPWVDSFKVEGTVVTINLKAFPDTLEDHSDLVEVGALCQKVAFNASDVADGTRVDCQVLLNGKAHGECYGDEGKVPVLGRYHLIK